MLWNVVPNFRSHIREGAAPFSAFFVCVGCVLVRDWQSRGVWEVDGSECRRQGQCCG